MSTTPARAPEPRSEAAPPAPAQPAPADHEAFKAVLGTFATGVTIVTALEDGLPVGFTCQSFTSLSLDPPMVAIAPAKSSTSWPRMVKAGAFCVNVLAEGQRQLCQDFAVSGGDKFSGVAWHLGEAAGAPVIDGSLATIECRLTSVHDAGDHELVTGTVLAMSLGERDGHDRPLLFWRGRFGSFDGADRRRRPWPRPADRPLL